MGVLDEYLALRRRDPAFEPARPVSPANVRPPERDAPVPLITDRTTARCADLFNVGYEVLLQVLQRYFAHTEETDAQLAVLADVAVGLMGSVVAPLGRLVTRLPVGPERPGRTAGPSFELFYETDYLSPHQETAWLLLEERLREAGAFCRRLADEAGHLSEALRPVAAALDAFAGTLAASRRA